MAEYPSNPIVCRCPACFAGDVDSYLLFDEKDQEYYCYRCCFTGTAETIDEYFNAYLPRKYREMA